LRPEKYSISLCNLWPIKRDLTDGFHRVEMEGVQEIWSVGSTPEKFASQAGVSLTTIALRALEPGVLCPRPEGGAGVGVDGVVHAVNALQGSAMAERAGDRKHSGVGLVAGFANDGAYGVGVGYGRFARGGRECGQGRGEKEGAFHGRESFWRISAKRFWPRSELAQFLRRALILTVA
jgi:hypothetical protein